MPDDVAQSKALKCEAQFSRKHLRETRALVMAVEEPAFIVERVPERHVRDVLQQGPDTNRCLKIPCDMESGITQRIVRDDSTVES